MRTVQVRLSKVGPPFAAGLLFSFAKHCLACTCGAAAEASSAVERQGAPPIVSHWLPITTHHLTEFCIACGMAQLRPFAIYI
jgi:hypothetical protein